MKTLFDQVASMEIQNRIEKISPNAKRQWGKMDVDQMLAHCANGLEMASGIIHPKRIFIGRIIGPLFRKKYSDEKPFDHSTPTSDELRVTGRKDFEAEKQRLIFLLKNFSAEGERAVTKHPHPFFGPLTAAEWGIGMYKHLDHHLRQFGG
jgi:hypothetical protein